MFLLFICKITELCDLFSEEDYTLSNFLVPRRDGSHLAGHRYLKYQLVLINWIQSVCNNLWSFNISQKLKQKQNNLFKFEKSKDLKNCWLTWVKLKGEGWRLVEVLADNKNKTYGCSRCKSFNKILWRASPISILWCKKIG